MECAQGTGVTIAIAVTRSWNNVVHELHYSFNRADPISCPGLDDILQLHGYPGKGSEVPSTAISEVMIMKIGIVVADAGRARIFATQQLGSPLEPLKDLANPYGSQLEQELTSDRSGHTRSSSGTGHTMSNKVAFKEQEAHHFAKGVVSELEKAHQRDQFVALYLVAAPRFLGHLRQELSPGLQKLISGELAKDLSLMSEQDIQKHLYNLKQSSRLH
jgi:protein required for attachment to host cells